MSWRCEKKSEMSKILEKINMYVHKIIFSPRHIQEIGTTMLYVMLTLHKLKGLFKKVLSTLKDTF